MTNEQYAAFIHEGGNDELIPLLWEKIRKLMYSKATAFYNARRSLCDRCGVALDDIKQECYSAFLDALRAYTGEQKCKFTSFLGYPFQNHVNALMGQRTVSGKEEPLNHCLSLDAPLTSAEGDTDTSRLDLLSDESSGDAFVEIEETDIHRIVRQEVEKLPEAQRDVIRLLYFENRTAICAAEIMNLSGSRIHQIRANALRELRKSKALYKLYREFWRHFEWVQFSRFEYSPQYFDLVEKLRERETQGEYISYGKKQAFLYSAKSNLEIAESKAQTIR